MYTKLKSLSEPEGNICSASVFFYSFMPTFHNSTCEKKKKCYKVACVVAIVENKISIMKTHFENGKFSNFVFQRRVHTFFFLSTLNSICKLSLLVFVE